MSQLAQQRSPRTLLECSVALQEVLYSSSGSDWSAREIVIEAAPEPTEGTSSPTVAPAASATGSTASGNSTGFILHEVERVLLQIRGDLDSPVPETTNDSPLMTRIRDHTNTIAVTLTGRPLNHDDKSTTIAQLIQDLNGLRASVENEEGTWCNIL